MDDKTLLNDDARLVAYLAGQLNADEAAQLERVITQDPLLATELSSMRLVYDIPVRRRHWDTERLRSSFFEWKVKEILAGKSRMTEHIRSTDSSVIPAYRRNQEHSGKQLGAGPQTLRNARQKEGVFSGRTLRRGGWYTVAGAVCGVMILITGWHVGTTGLSEQHQTDLSTTYVTENGQRANITLSDGSTVALNVASRLDVPADYATGDHTVHLTGEALFTVPHNTGVPFTVVAGRTTARVLGTSFTVRHYATDTTTRIAVREGKVIVGTTIVTANRLVEVGRHSGVRLSTVNPAEFSFATGALVLRRMRLSDAIPELDRWYNADIRLGDAELMDRDINGTLPSGSISDLESILELTFNARVVRDGRVLTLFSR